MLFNEKLRVLDPVKQGAVKTHLAVDPVTGHEYLLHWLPADGSAELARTLGLVDALPDSARQQILEASRRNGRWYLITERLPEFGGLEVWLQAAVSWRPPASLYKHATQARGDATDSAASPSTSGSGEFTRSSTQRGGVAGAAQNETSPGQTVQRSTSPESPSGEFTALFLKPRTARTPTAPIQPANAQAGRSRSGEFTRSMEAETNAGNPVQRPGHAGSERVVQRGEGVGAGRGESTAPFGKPRSDEAPPSRAHPGSNSKTAAGKTFEEEPGEYTRLFHSSALAHSATTDEKTAALPVSNTPQPHAGPDRQGRAASRVESRGRNSTLLLVIGILAVLLCAAVLAVYFLRK